MQISVEQLPQNSPSKIQTCLILQVVCCSLKAPLIGHLTQPQRDSALAVFEDGIRGPKNGIRDLRNQV